MPARAVIGRDEELTAIEAFLVDVEQGPTALVLSGEPGIGKTILWETGVDEGRRLLGSVLVGRGSEAEASLSFAGLSERALSMGAGDVSGPRAIEGMPRNAEVTDPSGNHIGLYQG
jgi:hypothetical protein